MAKNTSYNIKTTIDGITVEQKKVSRRRMNLALQKFSEGQYHKIEIERA